MRFIEITKSHELEEYPDHTHPVYELSLATSGNINIEMNSRIFKASEGDLIIVPPGVSHRGFDGNSYVNVFIHATDLDFYEYGIIHDYDGSIKTLFLMLEKVSSEKEANHANISDKLLDTICEYIKKHLRFNFKYDFVVKIKNLIYENLANPDFSISDEIRKIGFNSDYFRRCFREELHLSPLEYMTRLRIERAKSLLSQRSFRSVETVAALCGFNDSFYFSKIFKRSTGLSPRDYRKQALRD